MACSIADSFLHLHSVERLLYKHSVVVFPNRADLTTDGQHKLTQRFDPNAIEYGHGKVGRPDNKSILHPDLRNIAGTPVQLIGNGLIHDPKVLQGLPSPTQLRHPSHQTFHKTKISDEDSEKGYTRFYRWHVDAALYERDPPKVTTLCAKIAPQGKKNVVRYDDGTGDELEVPLGGTACESRFSSSPLRLLASFCADLFLTSLSRFGQNHVRHSSSRSQIARYSLKSTIRTSSLRLDGPCSLKKYRTRTRKRRQRDASR